MISSRTSIPARLIAAAALLGGFGFATPAAAHNSAEPLTTTATTTAGRPIATVGALLAIAGVIIGGLALARPASRLGTASGHLGATIALAAGLISIALGGLVVAAFGGGIGTGNGRAGAYLALIFGLLSVILGGLALTRSRRRTG